MPRRMPTDTGHRAQLVKIERLVIRNFRGFDNFALDVGGRSLFLIGENAGGKSSLLTAIVRALGRDLSFTRQAPNGHLGVPAPKR
jgi:predicted ATP-dependent endonuclease of OLD family